MTLQGIADTGTYTDCLLQDWQLKKSWKSRCLASALVKVANSKQDEQHAVTLLLILAGALGEEGFDVRGKAFMRLLHLLTPENNLAIRKIQTQLKCKSWAVRVAVLQVLSTIATRDEERRLF